MRLTLATVIGLSAALLALGCGKKQAPAPTEAAKAQEKSPSTAVSDKANKADKADDEELEGDDDTLDDSAGEDDAPPAAAEDPKEDEDDDLGDEEEY